MSTLFKGIDVSKWQGTVQWSKVTADFVIIRAGIEYSTDVKWNTNYAGANTHNIPKGAYWYSKALTVDSAVKEAKAFLAAVKGKKFEYPLYMDVEEQKQFNLGKSALSKIIRAFLQTVEAGGYWVGLYISKGYIQYVEADILSRYAMWVAQYNKSCTYTGQYSIWQYGIAGHPKWDTFNTKSVAGIRGQCDLDYCYYDYPSAIKKAGLNGYTKTAQQVVDTNPTPSTPPEAVKEPEHTVYVVKRGDNLWNIARKYLGNGARYKEIMSLNGMKTSSIYPGTKLKIPKK